MAGLRISYSAVSDVGRFRKDNQDSGYAGPWLLTVCDGVGGAARGDLASGTAVSQIRRLDVEPTDDILGAISGAMHRAQDRIAELVEQDARLSGTSTTAVVAVFDNTRFAIGHIGDSRAYLLSDGKITQVTKDHTFVQSLVDEGRISPSEAATHPHKNVILRALDAVQELQPDLFFIDVKAGDRLLVCSDGVESLDEATIGQILGDGTPDYAALELVRRALEAGSRDNVTCVIGEVVEESDLPADLQPLLVGSAAELPRLMAEQVTATSMPRPAPAEEDEDDTGELPPVDTEAARYAPQAPRRFGWLRRLLAAAVVLGLLWIAGAFAWSWSQRQFYVGVQDGRVAIFRGLNADVPLIEISHPYEVSDVQVDYLSEVDADAVNDGIEVSDLDEAHDTVENYAALQDIP